MLKTYAGRMAAGAVISAALTAGGAGTAASAAWVHAGASTAITCPWYPPDCPDFGQASAQVSGWR